MAFEWEKGDASQLGDTPRDTPSLVFPKVNEAAAAPLSMRGSWEPRTWGHAEAAEIARL